MLTPVCVIVGEGSPFSVKIAADETVDDLKDKIKDKNSPSITCDAKDLQLYCVDGLAQIGKTRFDLKGIVIDNMPAKLLDDFDGSTSEMVETFPLSTYHTLNDSSVGRIHVLVVVPEGTVSAPHSQSVKFQDDVRSELREIRTKVDVLTAILPHKSEKSFTDGALGQLECARLIKRKLIIDVAPIHDEEAFWSPIIQQQADAITNEAVFDAFITSYFNLALADSNMVFINSEKYRWLSPSTIVSNNTDLKPDGFATHPGMYLVKPEPQGASVRLTEHTFRFGLAVEDLFDCLILFESKLNINEAAFGQVVRYLQNHCPEASGSAILFDRRSFWLISSYKGFIEKVKIAKWVDGGSKSLFQKFIAANTPSWVSILTNACSSLGVHVAEGDSFLGRGDRGRVFKVIGQSGEVFALKIVDESFIRSLYQEEEALTKAQHTGLTVRLEKNCVEISDGAALLMSPVGTPLPRPTTRPEVANLFQFLWQLHEMSLVHGDPRVPNVILKGKQPLWIDFIEMGKASPYLRKLDAEILTQSILDIPRDIQLDEELEKMIDNYGKHSTSENINLLATQVCESMRLPY